MASTRGRRACCRPCMIRCSCRPCLLRSAVVPDLKFIQKCVSATETSQSAHLSASQMWWGDSVHSECTSYVTPHWTSILELQDQWLWGFLGELLILPCPVHKLPPTYQLLAMVRDGFSGLWIMLGLRTVLSDHPLRCLWQFWLHTYPVQLPKWDQGCNGKQCSPCATLAPVHRGESFTEVL